MENDFQRLAYANRRVGPDAIEYECLIRKNVTLACELIGRDLDAEWAKFNDWSKTTSANRTFDAVYAYKSAALYQCLPWDNAEVSSRDDTLEEK